METEALAEAASTAQLPFYCVRAVSDCACEDLPLDFNVMRDARGRLSRMRILSALIHRPTRIPKLLRFQQRCRTASHNLGVFLAGCEF
jgi:hypothetical protein